MYDIKLYQQRPDGTLVGPLGIDHHMIDGPAEWLKAQALTFLNAHREADAVRLLEDGAVLFEHSRGGNA